MKNCNYLLNIMVSLLNLFGKQVLLYYLCCIIY